MPRSASVRIVDEMGHEVEEPSEQKNSEDTVTEVRYCAKRRCNG